MRAYARLVRFEHTLFALPFAYVGMLMAAGGWPGWDVAVLVTMAMVGARTAAMAINRVADAAIDAANPRTREREIPVGLVRRSEGIALAIAGCAIFALAGWALNPLTLALLPVAVTALVLYPYTKRVTWACHAWLGATVGAAAPGGYIAVTGAFAPEALWLWAAVGLWIAGFDIVYALLDVDFDRGHGLHSLPARFGGDAAHVVAMALHAVAWGALAVTASLADFGLVAWAGVVAAAGIFIHQHRLVARRGAAEALRAFDANLWVGGVVLSSVVLDLVLRSG